MKKLVEKLVREGYLKTDSIIEAFLSVDRKDFVLEGLKGSAYEDIPLPIGWGQTISQPATVAFMLELLRPREGGAVLEIGSGSCWQTALLAHIVGVNGRIFAIERISGLFEWGKENFEKYAFGNTKFFCQDGTKGLREHAPFDKIIAAAAGHEMITAWQDQLKAGGCIVMPIEHSIWRYTKQPDGSFVKEEYPGFAFVPLIEG